jgi:hypothetical protein
VAYFCLFSAAMTWSFCVTKTVPFLGFCRRHFVFVAAAAIGLVPI